MRTEFLGID